MESLVNGTADNDLSRLEDLQPVEVPFTYQKVNYVLVEADADTTVKWRNELTRAATMKDGQVVSVRNMADVEPYLVSMCLYRVKDDGHRVNVPVADVRKMPHRVMKKLHAKVIEISELRETGLTLEDKIENAEKELAKLREQKEDKEKNALSATTDTSR